MMSKWYLQRGTLKEVSTDQTKISWHGPRYWMLPLLVFVIMLTGCTFDESGIAQLIPDLTELQPVEPTSSEQTLVFEDPGTLAIYHGSTCAESNQSGTERILTVVDRLVLPAYATAGTVYHNGAQFAYLNSDHHVAGLFSVVTEVQHSGNLLSWLAGGAFTDDNFDDGYSWCYYYTVAAWNQAAINAQVDHKGYTNATESKNETTALMINPGVIENTGFTPQEQVAMLPGGYAFRYGLSGREDHHILQMAYHMGYNESYIQYGKKYGLPEPILPSNADQADSNYLSWDSTVIFKDDDRRRNFQTAEHVSLIWGSDVNIIQPPFSILPHEDIGFWDGCIHSYSNEKSQEFVVENVPFEYAMPVLTGWDLNFECEDQHVAELGVWISDFQYEKSPLQATGTLRYTLSSILSDNGDTPGFWVNHNVSILGLKAIPSIPVGSEPPAIAPLDPAPAQATPLVVQAQPTETPPKPSPTPRIAATSIPSDTPIPKATATPMPSATPMPKSTDTPLPSATVTQIPPNPTSTSVTLGSIGGTLWQDQDGDGQIDNGEHRFEGAEIELRKGVCVLQPAPSSGFRKIHSQGNVQNASTDANGEYDFAELSEGLYCLRVNIETLSPVFGDGWRASVPEEFPSNQSPQVQVLLGSGETMDELNFAFRIVIN